MGGVDADDGGGDFVTGNTRKGDEGIAAAVGVEVAAAEADLVDAEQDVVCAGGCGFGNGVEGGVAGSFQNEGFHEGVSCGMKRMKER
jgi:hypothetical protein